MVFQLGDRRGGLIQGDDFLIKRGKGPVYLNAHHTRYADGVTDNEITRIGLEDDEKLQITRLEVKRDQGLATDSNFTVDFYDETAGELLVETSDEEIAGDDPLAESSVGAEVIVRVTNQTGDTYDASITGLAFIRQA
jgi:hypothetical protein